MDDPGNFSPSSEQCGRCDDGYYNVDGKCVEIPIDNCKNYDPTRILCVECDDHA